LPEWLVPELPAEEEAAAEGGRGGWYGHPGLFMSTTTGEGTSLDLSPGLAVEGQAGEASTATPWIKWDEMERGRQQDHGAQVAASPGPLQAPGGELLCRHLIEPPAEEEDGFGGGIPPGMAGAMPLVAGSWVMVSAGNSSIGICLTQLARARGYRTVSLVRRQGNPNPTAL